MKWFILILFAVATGCAGGGHHQTQPRTRLTVVVYRGHSHTRYTLTCGPPGGAIPDPARACRALEDFARRGRRRHTAHTCLCALYVNRIVVRGVVDGRRLAGPVEVSGCAACGMGRRAAADVAQAFAAMHLRAG
jgi:hypothetical protein